MLPWLTMRRLAALLTLLIAPTLLAQYGETLTVERILLDVRVTDFSGEAVLGLETGDFEVTIGGRKTDVLSVTWVDESPGSQVTRSANAPAGDDPATRPPDHPATSDTPAGRLFVYFIQTDFGRESTRVRGQMGFMRHAERLVEMLGPDDRVAVFSFDSHLKFRLDFTSDRGTIIDAMRGAMLINEPPPPQIVPNPALARRLDREEMKNAADSETALILVANALRPIPGPKSLMLMGWGLGQLTSAGVRMKPKYPIARRALDAARVTVFALDTTYADSHSLEVGLGKAAADTGGFYAKTHVFPMQAVDRLKKTLAGHYELELRRPGGLARGTHDLVITVKRRNIHLLAPGSWVDR